jgi:hypothetical protein
MKYYGNVSIIFHASFLSFGVASGLSLHYFLMNFRAIRNRDLRETCRNFIVAINKEKQSNRATPSLSYLVYAFWQFSRVLVHFSIVSILIPLH